MKIALTKTVWIHIGGARSMRHKLKKVHLIHPVREIDLEDSLTINKGLYNAVSKCAPEKQ